MPVEKQISWGLWNYWRDLEDNRRWRGRGKNRPTVILSLDEEPYPNTESFARPTRGEMLPVKSFEDNLVNQMDAENVLITLTRFQRRVVVLQAQGYTASEIALHFSTSRASVVATVYKARKKIREYCDTCI